MVGVAQFTDADVKVDARVSFKRDTETLPIKLLRRSLLSCHLWCGAAQRDFSSGNAQKVCLVDQHRTM